MITMCRVGRCGPETQRLEKIPGGGIWSFVGAVTGKHRRGRAKLLAE
jgi:hypothetical protein